VPKAQIARFDELSRPEADRAADSKRRVIETLHVRPGDTVADMGCGDGFYTILLAHFVGPSGKA